MKKLALAAALLLSGCNPVADTKAAEGGVVQFHQAMNAGEFDGMYSGASAEMKTASSRDDFIKLMTALHTKLGAFKSGKTTNWNDNSTTSGHFITLVREAQFDKGPATEQFVFRIDGDHASLAGYNINSRVLITG